MPAPARPPVPAPARPPVPAPARQRTAMALALAVLAAGALTTGCGGASAAQDGLREWSPGQRPVAPAVTGSTLDARPYDSAAARGKVVVMNFWASWCPPCQDEAATLQQVYADTKGSGVTFVGVDVRDDRSAARSFARAHGITYPSIFDPSSETLLAFRKPTLPTSPPTTLVIDREGRVAAMIAGAATFTRLEPLVRRVAAEES
ncbi:MAG: TlpA family protein disulfide reductase [Frankiaceae bacterium]